jgi:hypothetical protein
MMIMVMIRAAAATSAHQGLNVVYFHPEQADWVAKEHPPGVPYNITGFAHYVETQVSALLPKDIRVLSWKVRVPGEKW